jgi:hypothetical protein
LPWWTRLPCVVCQVYCWRNLCRGALQPGQNEGRTYAWPALVLLAQALQTRQSSFTRWWLSMTRWKFFSKWIWMYSFCEILCILCWPKFMVNDILKLRAYLLNWSGENTMHSANEL